MTRGIRILVASIQAVAVFILSMFVEDWLRDSYGLRSSEGLIRLCIFWILWIGIGEGIDLIFRRRRHKSHSSFQVCSVFTQRGEGP